MINLSFYPNLVNFLATYLIFIFPIIFTYYFLIKRDYLLIFRLCTSIILEKICELIIKSLIVVPRPYIINKLPTFVTFPPIDSSFPSGHTAMAATFAATVFFQNKKLGNRLFVLAIIIGMARVLANVHRPVDILGGLILGVIIGIFCGKMKIYARNYSSTSTAATSSRKKTARHRSASKHHFSSH